jgi:hypothetical protein
MHLRARFEFALPGKRVKYSDNNNDKVDNVNVDADDSS